MRHGLKCASAGILVAALGLGACRTQDTRPLVIASTTSLHDSGLLDALVPAFTTTHPGREVRVLAVGSGEALSLGRRGDVDLVLVHAPDAEREFVRDGHARRRIPFLRNDFVIAGPPHDPAGVRGSPGAARALAAIAASGSRFVSRDDSSGTHMRELELWRTVRIRPAGPWYDRVGQGMGIALLIASERSAYILSDRATLLTMAAELQLEKLLEGDPALENPYSALEVTGAPGALTACLFSRWLRGPEARSLIQGFRATGTERSLFEPIEGPEAADVLPPCGAGAAQ